jgi:hypothetical protein
MTFFLLLVGCDEIDALLGGVTNPDVAEGLVLGMQVDPGLDLTNTAFAGGGRGAAYLSTIGGAPPETADLTLVSTSNGILPLTGRGDGVWTTNPDGGLAYVPGETWTLKRDGSEILRAEAAGPASLNLLRTITEGDEFTIDIGDQDYDGLLVSVVDLADGTQKWSNFPDTAGMVYDMLLSEPVLDVEVPAEALTPGEYAVGFAALRANESVQTTDVNALASLMATGVLEFRSLTVEPAE